MKPLLFTLLLVQGLVGQTIAQGVTAKVTGSKITACSIDGKNWYKPTNGSCAQPTSAQLHQPLSVEAKKERKFDVTAKGVESTKLWVQKADGSWEPLPTTVNLLDCFNCTPKIPVVTDAVQTEHDVDADPNWCNACSNGSCTLMNCFPKKVKEKYWTCKDDESVLFESVSGKKHLCVRF